MVDTGLKGFVLKSRFENLYGQVIVVQSKKRGGEKKDGSMNRWKTCS